MMGLTTQDHTLPVAGFESVSFGTSAFVSNWPVFGDYLRPGTSICRTPWRVSAKVCIERNEEGTLFDTTSFCCAGTPGVSGIAASRPCEACSLPAA